MVGVLLLYGARPAAAADHLVLIASVNAPVSSLNSLEIQKLFLGLTVVTNGIDLHPLRNESDEAMRQLFYQDVVSMSEPVYERRLLALTLQQGRTAPPVYRDTRALLNALAADPHAVSYAWASDIARDGRVRILKLLGRE
ncbi:MAG: hypothetical protein JSR15_01405 [Proteobacteria bacterium]|nr:hypothetical protein [Pseudomonadota bacterium]